MTGAPAFIVHYRTAINSFCKIDCRKGVKTHKAALNFVAKLDTEGCDSEIEDIATGKITTYRLGKEVSVA